MTSETVYEYTRKPTPLVGEQEKLLTNLRETTPKILKLVPEDQHIEVTDLANRLEEAINVQGKDGALRVLLHELEDSEKKQKAKIKIHYRLAA